MKMPKKLYVLVCDEWNGRRYNRQNVGVYTSMDTGKQAAEYMQGSYETADIYYWVDEVEFCEIWK